MKNKKEIIEIGMALFVIILAIRFVLLFEDFTWEGLGEFLIGYVLFAALVGWVEKLHGLKTILYSCFIFTSGLLAGCFFSLLIRPDLKVAILGVVLIGFILIFRKLC